MEQSVKLCCSLRWLYGILSKHPTSPDPGYMLRLSQLLLEPYEGNLLKNETIFALTSPTLYVQAYNAVFPGQLLPECSFEVVTQSLARKGGYVLEDDGTIVSVPMLAQRVPFREKSHLALLDVLMVQYASKIITVQRVVQSVRKLATFNASKELPCKVEVELLLMLWLNKVSEAVYSKRADEINSLLQSTDPKQRKKNKAVVEKSGGYPAIPLISGDICVGISDGQSLAALMLHYAPNSCSWNDFKIRGHPLKRKKALKNLNFVCEFCSTHFAAPAFHLSPSEIVELGPSGVLKGNIVAMLANLFYCFELSENDSYLKMGLMSTSNSSVSNLNTSERTLVDSSSLRLCSILTNTSGISISSKPSSSKQRVAELGSEDQTPTNSTSALRVFNAPFRSSLNKTQSKVLAAFGRDKSRLKGSHTKSSPLIQCKAVPSSELISASTESLNLQSQMTSTRSKSRSSFLSKFTNPLRLNRSYASQADNKTSQFSTMVNRPSSYADETSDSGGTSTMRGSETSDSGVAKAASMPQTARKNFATLDKAVSMPRNVRESFTLDKQHTHATASAAGLPIINNRKITPPLHASDEPDVAFPSDQMNSSSTRVFSKPGDAIMLTNLLQLHHGDATYTISAQKQPIPPNVKELRVNLRSFISNLQSETVHMEREAMIQRLHLYDRVKGKKVTTVVPGTASAPLITAPSDTDIRSFKSVPAISPCVKKHHVPKNPSLEQFERDEYLIRLQTSEENSIEIRHETQPIPPQPEAGGILKHHRPHQAPLSPFSNGEILEFPSSVSPHSHAAPPVSPGWARKPTKEYPLDPELTCKPLDHTMAEADEPPRAVTTRGHIMDETFAPGTREHFMDETAEPSRAVKSNEHMMDEAFEPSRAVRTRRHTLAEAVEPSRAVKSRERIMAGANEPPRALESREREHFMNDAVKSPRAVKNREHILLEANEPLRTSENKKHIMDEAVEPSRFVETREQITVEAVGPSRIVEAKERNMVEAAKPSRVVKNRKSAPSLSGGRATAQQTTEAEVEGSVNPWEQPFLQNSKLETMRKKEQLIRARMEERDRVRRVAAEERRLAEEQRAAEVRQAAEEQREAELRRLEEKIEKKSAKLRQKKAPVLEQYASAIAADHNKEASNTIHFHFSNHHHHTGDGRETEGTSAQEDLVTPCPGHPHTGMVLVMEGGSMNEYRGPECYIKPKSKSNLKIIKNAICSVCLAGEVNMSLKLKTLAELERTGATHVMILFRDTVGFKFRGIYAYTPGDRHVVRIYGTGPREITELMTSHLYKYNSGQKEFKEIPSRSLSVSVDALTIKSEYWQSAVRRRRTLL